MKKIKILIFFVFSLTYCQSEFQILTIPNEVSHLSSNGIKNETLLNKKIKQDYKYSFNVIQYPASIRLYNFAMNKYYLSFLDYGLFEDRINDTLYKTFSAYEITGQFFIEQKIRNNIIKFKFGFLNSKIYNYSAFAQTNSISFRSIFKKNNISIGLSIENFGILFKSYTAYNQKLPIQYRFSLNKIFKSFEVSYDLLYQKYFDEFQNILSLKFYPNDKLSFQISNSSNYSNLSYEDNKYHFLSGFGLGLEVYLKDTILKLGIQNLGSAGTALGTSVSFLNK